MTLRNDSVNLRTLVPKEMSGIFTLTYFSSIFKRKMYISFTQDEVGWGVGGRCRVGWGVWGPGIVGCGIWDDR